MGPAAEVAGVLPWWHGTCVVVPAAAGLTARRPAARTTIEELNVIRKYPFALLFATAALLAAPVRAQVTDAMIESDATSPGNVLTNGLGTQGQRFSPLTRIN